MRAIATGDERLVLGDAGACAGYEMLEERLLLWFAHLFWVPLHTDHRPVRAALECLDDVADPCRDAQIPSPIYESS